MKIAIAVDGDLMNSPVSKQFEDCSNLLIVDVNTMEFKVIPNPETSDEIVGDRLAKELLQHDCEAVITGLIKTPAFDIIADGCMTRYNGVGHDAAKALELMNSFSLALVRDANGGKGCTDDDLVVIH